MCNQQGVTDLRVALYAPDVFEVEGLIRQPSMPVKNVRVFQCSKQLVLRNVGMTAQADLIIILDKILHILIGTGIDPVFMRVMAHPAGKIFRML